ncbi:hypothetical protein IQ07DRAFT_586646 [Pyrenochaeta sp. DS3sAY3a]|nr:hypothetical protein IQ07DRAFT_586646 [Pyrenochaeta sp. DS3sAY3a]
MYTAFQKHLLFFSTLATPPRLTFYSALRASIALGLNLPIAVVLSVSLRVLYVQLPRFWSPVFVDRIPNSAHRAQLTAAHLPPEKSEFSCTDLLQLLSQNDNEGFFKRKINEGHIIGFWAMAADARTHTVAREDVRRFQQGNWEASVVEKRRDRTDVLPVWRGGPIWVEGHSWAVKKLLGIRVYESKTV